MADTALENAMRSRDDLAAKVNKAQEQIDAWRREMAEAEAFINSWHRWAGTESPLPAEPRRLVNLEAGPLEAGMTRASVENRSQDEARKRPMDNSKKEDVAAEVRRIIEERGRVVPRKELLPELIERGFTIEGTDPDMVLSTMLWRAGKDAGVVRVGRAGYWLMEKDWPEANYFPQAAEKLSDAFASGDLGMDQEAFGGIASAMDSAIETVFSDLSTDRLFAINADIDAEIGLPPEVDRRINESVEDVLGRELTDDEKLALADRVMPAIKRFLALR